MNDQDKVIRIIAEELDIEQGAISEASTLDELGADSPQLLELALEIEGSFNIKVPDVALSEFRTVGDVIEFVQNSVKK